ncbi:putative RNA-directed DNA polymerase from transposon BS [Trichonephila clavipes]|nr:putative RNA-directed DNA polymerase from transposon BS [Trichonephila clavipes]
MECMVLRRLTHHLHTNDYMPLEQFAFRKGHSTFDQILYFTQCVRDSQNHKPMRHTIAAFLDVSKTFDRGCVLSPTLFSLFISGVEKYVNPSQIGLFADDVVLWCSDANISKMESQLNRSLVNIQEFADNHKITFNSSKDTVSLFTTNRHPYNYSPEIFLMNASTLRKTYTTLVHPVFEYGYQIFQVASPTNLKKLDRVQLNTARIITGLRYGYPADIVLYEADIQPLTMRFEVISYRYFNKIKIFGSFNRISSFILNWTSNQRLKQDIPFNYMRKYGFIDFNVDISTPFSCITPIDYFNHVEFREELLTSTPKSIAFLPNYSDNWPLNTGLDILSKLVRLGQRKQVCLQWIPSHAGVPRNEAADELAGNPPAHHWYAAKSPNLSIQCRSSRAHQTALARFRRGHLRSMTFGQGVKSFFTCPCSLLAYPAHLLDCWSIFLRQLY